MSAFYDEMAQLVIDLLAEFGTAITLRRTLNDASVVTYETVGVFTDPTSYRIRPVTLDTAPRRATLNNTVEPKDTDRLIADGVSLIITRVDIIKPANKVLGYRVELADG